MDNILRLQKNLLFLRNLLGWNAKKLGDELGVARQTINKIETNKSPLSKVQFLALLTVFKNEINKHIEDTRMFHCILDILVLNPDEYSQEDVEPALKSADFLISSISSGKASRKVASDEWVKHNKKLYQIFFNKLLAEHQESEHMLNQINPTGQNTSVFEIDNTKAEILVPAKKIDFSRLLEDNESEVVKHIYTLYTSYVLDTIRHELWMYVDKYGRVSLRENLGYAATRLSEEQRCFIFACGGENIKPWNLLPKITVLLGEDLDICIDKVAQRTGKERSLITIRDMQRYLEDDHQEWIAEWLDDFFSDPYGHIEEYAYKVYEDLVARLDGI